MPIRSLAVLPFENLSGDPEQDYFADGMRFLITSLAQVHACASSRHVGDAVPAREQGIARIAEELDVDAVVEGTVSRAGDRVRITAQLIQATTDRHLWAQSYEREARDVLALQSEVAAAIAQAVEVKLQPEEKLRMTRAAAPVQPEAYEAYLKGRFYWSKRSPETSLKAVGYFQQAIELDPAYAPAYSGLSDTYRAFDVQGLAPPRECMPKAEAAARKALALDDTLAEAHASLAGVLYRYDWDWQGAEREFRLALELEPNYAEGHRVCGVPDDGAPRSARGGSARPEAQPAFPRHQHGAGNGPGAPGPYDGRSSNCRRPWKSIRNSPAPTRPWPLPTREKATATGAGGFREEAGRRARPVSAWLGYAYGVTGRRKEALRSWPDREALPRALRHTAILRDRPSGLGNTDEAGLAGKGL